MSDEAVAQVVREEWGRLTAQLLARFRRLDLVEDALGDAVESATRTWREHGVPESPGAWLLTAASRRMLDRLRAEAVHQRRAPLLLTEAERNRSGRATIIDPGGLVEDDTLRLVLLCTHPALAPEAAAALSLRLVLGVSTHDIARLFLVPEPTMAARITRAKKKIVTAGIPFTVPGQEVLPHRLDTVAQTAYLAFTAGYAPGSGRDLLRADLAGEALRLVRTTLALQPGTTVLRALLALMLLQHSRRDARSGPDGALVLLPDQDRSRWRDGEITEGLDLLRSIDPRDPVTPQTASFLLQARIAAEHATAPTSAETRWERIVAHYDALLSVMPSPAAELARAVAVAEAAGPAAGLRALEEVPDVGSHRPSAVRAELLRRTGRFAEARDAYRESIRRCRNEAEVAHLAARLETLGTLRNEHGGAASGRRGSR